MVMLNDYNYAFRNFDPLDGNFPEPYAVMFNEINYRARKILEKFSSEEINKAALSINEIIKDKNFIDPFVVARKKELIPTPMFGKTFDVYQMSNNNEAIYENIPNIVLENHIELKDFDWAHLFAVISVFYSELLTELLISQSNQKIRDALNITDERIMFYANEFVIEAKQALTISELLINQEKAYKDRQSKQAKNAIKKRFESTTKPLENLVISMYEEKFQSVSNRSAGSKIFKELTSTGRINFDIQRKVLKFDGEDCLYNDDPEHMFEKWIGRFKRGSNLNNLK